MRYAEPDCRVTQRAVEKQSALRNQDSSSIFATGIPAISAASPDRPRVWTHVTTSLKATFYYHFTVGGPVEDKRLTTLPAYKLENEP
jgi:hypothetical protein